MRRFPLALLGSALLASCVVFAAAEARAQDGPAVPPPMDPNAPGAPGAPGSPAAPGAPGSPAVGQEAAQLEELNKAEREDSGRHFELFWIDGNVGGSYIDMRQFSSETLGVEKASSVGPAFSLGAGLRFVVFVVGARARYNALSAFNMWQINGELGLKFPIRSFDFLIGGHGGYSFVGRLGDASVAANTNTPTDADAVKVRGFNAGLDVALDYYVSPTFSIGVGGMADALFLNRPPAPLPDLSALPPAERAAAEASIQNDPLYQKSGASIGMQLGVGLRLGLHFGL
jgi:hypothetical protein